jgi:maltose-binding protein MalE
VKIVKVAAIGLAAVASLGLVAACGSTSTPTSGASSSSSAAASASAAVSSSASSGADRFTQAATNLKGAPYKFSFTSDSTADSYAGSADPLAGLTVANITIEVQSVKVTAAAQLSADSYYVKVSGLELLGIDSTKYYHADPTKISGPNPLIFGAPTDPTGVSDLAGAVASADPDGANQIKGTFDFTKQAWGPVNAATVTGLGANAKAVPFVATFDDKNRLTKIVISVPSFGSTKANTITGTYSDFGVAVVPSTPATSDVVEAPDALYNILKG